MNIPNHLLNVLWTLYVTIQLSNGAFNTVKGRNEVTDDDDDGYPSYVGTPSSSSSPSNLTCYSCTTFADYTCRTFNASSELEAQAIGRRECNHQETHCSVTRVEYMSSERPKRKFWALERGCSSNCIPGCIILGEGERTKLHLCNSCCQSPLCNVNDLAPDPRESISCLLMIFLSLNLLFLL